MEQASQMPAPPAQQVTGNATTASALAIVGGVLVALGSILPWAKVSVLTFLSVSVKGTEGDGKITLVLGILLALVGVFGLLRGWFVRVAALVLGLGSLAMAIYEISQVNSALDDFDAQTKAVANVSMGIGLWLIVAGALVGIATFFLKTNRS